MTPTTYEETGIISNVLVAVDWGRVGAQLDTPWIAYGVAFVAALFGTAVGGVISWLLHRSTARRELNLHIIEAAYGFYGDLQSLARADATQDAERWITRKPAVVESRRSAFRLKLLLLQRHRTRSVAEHFRWRESRRQRQSAIGDEDLGEVIDTTFNKLWEALKNMPVGFAVDESTTLGFKAMGHMNKLQKELRAALEHLPSGGLDQFLLEVAEASERFDQRIAGGIERAP